MTIGTGPTVDRSSYLGASDIAAVIGIAPYKTALDVWAEKTQGLGVEDNPAMEVGRELERPILETLYARPRRLVLYYPGTLRNPDETWMAATPDATAGVMLGDDPPRGVECKVVGFRQASRWGEPEAGEAGVPPEVVAQVAWQLEALRSVGNDPLRGVRAYDRADVVALIGTELRVFEVEHDAEFGAHLIAAGRAWWERHIVGGEMPMVVAGQEVSSARRTLARLFPTPGETLLAMRADVRDLARKYDAARREEKIAARGKAFAAFELERLIAAEDARGFEGDGFKIERAPEAGRVSYKAIVDDLGVSEAERDRHRGDPVVKLRVSVPEEGEPE